MTARFAAAFLVALCGATDALAGEAFLGLSKPAAAQPGGWARIDGLDVTWESAAAADAERRNEELVLSVRLSPVSAHLADSHRTRRPIDTLYLRIADEDGGERYYRLRGVVVTRFAPAPADSPAAPETATIVAERIQRLPG